MSSSKDLALNSVFTYKNLIKATAGSVVRVALITIPIICYQENLIKLSYPCREALWPCLRFTPWTPFDFGCNVKSN